MRTRKLRFVPIVVASLIGAATLAGSPQPAEAVVVERIVAVVGDRPILLSQLQDRGQPFLTQIYRRVQDPAQRTASESQMYKDLLEKMVEEELIRKAADKANIVISSTELDAAFENIAASQGMTVDQLYNQAATSSGLSQQEYRDEIRRQILEGKLLQLRVKGRVRVTEESLRSAYERAKREERKWREYRPAWIVLRILPGSSPDAIRQRKELAADIVRRARAGESFEDLALEYSDDTATKNDGGQLGIRAPAGSRAAMSGRAVVAPQLEEVINPLEPGEIADAVMVPDALVIIKLIDRQPSRYTSYEEARNEMAQRVQQDLMVKEKKVWLEDLRRKTHVDVRL